ncbi:MAG TPA: HEAT repeat domain-containing protein [Marmoricola sp.]|nr:HEAT repeat domain-containing protein [Marmoricola sp.]
MRARVLLLAAQAVLLGLVSAFLVVPASALFLHRYGADDLPYTYLGAAVAGVLVSTAMRRAQRLLALGQLAAVVIGTIFALVTAGWLVLELDNGLWVTFPLIVLFPVTIPVGFVLIGSQAGRLMDVREMKAYFPRVVAGFSVGLGGGALVAAWLVHVVGGPVTLLAVDAGAAATWLAVALVTARRHADVLLVDPQPAPTAGRSEPEPARTLLSNKLVVSVFGYQIFSAMVTQLLDYMVWERAAARYPDASDLARFQGIFGAVINVSALAFVVFFAGRLLTRIGVGASLAANPLGVLVVLGVGVVLGFGGGVGATAFFLAMCTSQVVDLTLTDGTTRTSVNATYQALDPRDRLPAQTRVEGAGIPLAVGLVGVLLLLFRGLSLDVGAVAVVTFVLTICWLWLSRFAAREYVAGLRTQFTRPAWEAQPLVVDEDSRAAAVRLLDSPDPRDVRVAVGALAGSLDGDPSPALVQVERLLADPSPRVRLRAAAVLAGADAGATSAALELWRGATRDPDPEVVEAAVEAAADHPHPFFVPQLVDLAATGRRLAPDLPRALAAHADWLLPTLDRADDDLPGPVRDHVLQAVARAGVPAARGILLDRLVDPDPATRQAAARLLVVTPASGSDDLPALRPLLEVEAERCARTLAVLDGLPDDAHTAPLRQGLCDELDALAAHTSVLLALTSGDHSVENAALALRTGQDRGLALELVESAGARGDVELAITLIDPMLEPNERLAHLIRFAPPEADARTWLRDLVADPGGRWHSGWLRACALYAGPALLGADVADLARPWVDDADPAVAETARWAIEQVSAALG